MLIFHSICLTKGWCYDCTIKKTSKGLYRIWNRVVVLFVVFVFLSILLKWSVNAIAMWIQKKMKTLSLNIKSIKAEISENIEIAWCFRHFERTTQLKENNRNFSNIQLSSYESYKDFLCISFILIKCFNIPPIFIFFMLKFYKTCFRNHIV